MSLPRYETVYGVHLLDDLHNYFPAILYDRARFGDVQSLLGYVHSQMDSLFNIYARGTALYRQTHPVPRPPSARPPPRAMTPLTTPPPAPHPPITPPPRMHTTRTRVQTPPEVFREPLYYHPSALEERELVTETIDLTPLLSTVAPPLPGLGVGLGGLGAGLPRADTMNVVQSLLSLFNSPLREGAWGDLSPVVVRPTQEQIDAATNLRQASPDDETTQCSVCQEEYVDGQAIRVLNHCNHEFHRNCIDPWFERNVHCPVCRHDIREA